MSSLQLKLILLLRSVPNNDIKLRELLTKGGLIERFTPYLGRRTWRPRPSPERRGKGVVGEASKRGNR
jgi:hypothetical protein